MDKNSSRPVPGRAKASLGKRRLLLLPLALICSFVYGYLCSEAKLPPYSLIRATHEWARDQPSIRRVYRFVRGVGAAEPNGPQGRWRKLRDRPAAGRELTQEQREAVDRLHSIGYLSGYEKAGDRSGVTAYVPDLAFNALNLYTSGEAAAATLMDMTGDVLHRWAYRFHDAFPDDAAPEIETWIQDRRAAYRRDPGYWRRVHLGSDGTLIAIYEGSGLVKLDKDSNLIWAKPCGCHHDLFEDENGYLYVLTREVKILPRINKYEPVLEDFIAVLDSEGSEVRRVSLLEAFERSSFASFLDAMPEHGDLFHTNTIELLDGSLAGRFPPFRKGNVLVSMRETNVIAIVDMEEERVVWALSGQWAAQHQPTVLENGNILLFDNRGHHGMSKVIEFRPPTQDIVWAYEGTSENGFNSRTCGSNQRLPNGNTLITESDAGRAFEVTRGNRIVWEFLNPARAGEDDDLIATLFEMVRLDPGFPVDWLEQDTE